MCLAVYIFKLKVSELFACERLPHQLPVLRVGNAEIALVVKLILVCHLLNYFPLRFCVHCAGSGIFGFGFGINYTAATSAAG